jgi:predicted nucleic acid-binding protein
VNVYVETNFVLELALLQEQHGSCGDLLRLCEEGRIQLVIPAYSLAEPYETLTRRHRQRKRLEGVRSHLLQVAEVIPLEASLLAAATQYQRTHGLSPQDALVYASILLHLKQRQTLQSCFLNRNAKDFDDPDLVEELDVYNCKLLPQFDAGYQFVLSCLS